MRESKALFLSSSKGEWRLENLFLGIFVRDAKKASVTAGVMVQCFIPENCHYLV